MSILIYIASPSFPFCSLCSDPAAQNNPNCQMVLGQDFPKHQVLILTLCLWIFTISTLTNAFMFFTEICSFNTLHKSWNNFLSLFLWRTLKIVLYWDLVRLPLFCGRGCTCVGVKPVWLFYSRHFNSQKNLMAEVKQRVEPSPRGRHVTTRALSVHPATLKPAPNSRNLGLSFSTSYLLQCVLAEDDT